MNAHYIFYKNTKMNVDQIGDIRTSIILVWRTPTKVGLSM